MDNIWKLIVKVLKENWVNLKVILIIGVRINKLCRKIEMVWKDEKKYMMVYIGIWI